MVDIKTLLPELRELVGELSEDLLARSTSDATINAGLKEAFQQIEKGGRTAQAFEVWREDYLDQVAVAWVLACVFVRFMEDNGLIDECWLAGEGERRRLADDTHTLFFREHAHDTDREYFQHVFKEVGKIPAAKDLFAEGKTPLWAVAPSGDAAMKLLKFWREMEAATGHLKRSFQVESGDTRFLGDLYQELSIKAQKKYALLQTPVFVEEFILDRTLTPALAEFGLEKVRMIDPTCGSGHFLLGGFARLFDLWSKPDHTTGNAEKDAQKAFDGVWGVDINPFAVAIARFRLIVAAVQACGIKRLKKAPGWNIHLASGDSLLFGSRPSFDGQRTGLTQQLSLFEVPAIYATEDRKSLQQILGQGYHVVVGNPPYITVKDKAQNEAYRRNFSQVCHRQYSLGVPFTQRFWELAIQKKEDGATEAGHIGMITANSFMKREFGKKLIENYFPKMDLTHVVDTSGAFIPGHGTPTVILFGRSRSPIADKVRAVLGINAEPCTPEDASQGLVWRSIVARIDTVNAEDAFTSSADVTRISLASHPWSIGGGGVGDVRELIEANSPQTLESVIRSIGFYQDTHADEIFVQPTDFVSRHGVSDGFKPQIGGEEVRDWVALPNEQILFPFDSTLQLWPSLPSSRKWSWLWCQRTWLWDRSTFGGGTYRTAGRAWYDYHQFPKERARTPLSLAFAFLSTHNHFVFDKGGKVFKRSAPIIKLRTNASDEEHLGLLGLLNSSCACFWLKQVMAPKGGGGIGRGIQDEQWEVRFDISGTQLERFPIQQDVPLALSTQLDALGRNYGLFLPEQAALKSTPSVDSMAKASAECKRIRGKMIALQEELDWHCYQIYGLLSDNLRYTGDDLPELSLGQRAFEIIMARQMDKGEFKTAWFERHGSTPITEIPSHWPVAYRKVVERRINVIETNNEIALIEKPEYKRRWNDEPWEAQEQRALKNWLLDRLEAPKYRKGTKDSPELTTAAQMADVASADAEFLQVAALYRGRPDFSVAALVSELVEGESVPFLPILRYKPAGLRKREVWERTWDLQRQQDALAQRRQKIKDQEGIVWERIARSFPEDRQLLEAMDTKMKVRCLQVKTDFAPKVVLKDGWKGTTMVAELCDHGVATPKGALALQELITLKEDYRELDSKFNQKIHVLYIADPETKSLKVERESIPDDPDISVPPKYISGDFLKTDIWRLRGKLDVPKERWVSYPHCSTDSDTTLVVGWAGWNHLEQATALIAYYDARKREGWDAKRLTPLLAGLDQLLPWIHQWHPEIDAEFGETAGQSFQTMLEHDAHELGMTLDDVRNWTPPEKVKKTRTSGKKKTTAGEQDDA